MRDIRGNHLKIGSEIVYPVRNGATVRMKQGVVNQLLCSCGASAKVGIPFGACSSGRLKAKVYKHDTNKVVTLTSFDNVVVVG